MLPCSKRMAGDHKKFILNRRFAENLSIWSTGLALSDKAHNFVVRKDKMRAREKL